MLLNIKSHYFMQLLFSYNKEIKNLKLLKYNKELQKREGINIETYKYFRKIEIEIIPHKEKLQCLREYIKNPENVIYKFINYTNKDKPYFHIYFNDSELEAYRNYIRLDENISKIKVIIDYKFKAISELFNKITGMKEIKFIRFNRNDCEKLTSMFYSCEFLVNIDLSKLKTDNVINMGFMFENSTSLRIIDLSNLKTNKVINMGGLFKDCSNLKYLDLSSFDTSNVKYMDHMFYGCENLEAIKLSNFDTSNVIDMKKMFYRCNSLLDIDISNFNLKNVNSMKGMFGFTKKDLIKKIKIQNPGIRAEAFYSKY